jgi:tetratricopeptide (TPR) repeat protein
VEGTQRAEAAFGGTAEQALRDINHTTNHYYGDGPVPITPGTSVAPPLGRLNHEVRGRSGLVAAVTAELGGSIAVLAAAGGFGKTTVALDVARILPRVWWVDASSRDSLVSGLAEVALQAGADQHEVREAWAGRGGSAIELLWRNLDDQSEPWVLVFDNADDPDVLAATNHRVADGNGWLRTPKSTGSILVTSRAGAGWPPAARVRHVRQLDPEDGAQVLLDLADAGTRQDATTLARRLGGLPLALRLAGRYLAVAKDALALPGLEPPITFKAYLERWDERFTELTEGESASPRESLSRTWEMSMDLLAERGQPQTRQLLRLISTFAEAPVPAFVLDAAVMARSRLLKAVTAAQLSVLLRALQEVGLLDVVESSVVVHPVVRSANRHQPDFERNEQAYEALVVHLLRHATHDLDHDDPATWPRWHSALPHLTELRSISRPKSKSMLASLLHDGAGFTNAIGWYRQAEDLYRRATVLNEEVGAKGHRNAFAARHALGHVLRAIGDLAGSEVEHRSLVVDQARVFGADHPSTLNARNCLAWVLRDQGRWDEAEVEFREVLDERVRGEGATALATLGTRHSLGHLLETRARFAEAETEFRTVIAGMADQLGPSHVDVVRYRKCLAALLERGERPDEAEAESREILAILDSEDAEVRRMSLEVRFQLARMLRARNRLADAGAEYRTVLDGAEQFYGADHHWTLYVRHDIGDLFRDQRDLGAAEAELRAVAEAQERILGSTHPDTLHSRTCLAGVLLRLERFEEAETETLWVLSVRERLLGADHPTTTAVRHQLAHLYHDQGRAGAAEEEHRRVVASRLRLQGANHPATLEARSCLALLLIDQGRFEEAEAEYRLVLDGQRENFGAENPITVRTRYHLAGVLAELGRRAEAEAEYRAVLEAETRALGSDHPDTAKTREKLAALVDQDENSPHGTTTPPLADRRPPVE